MKWAHISAFALVSLMISTLNVCIIMLICLRGDPGRQRDCVGDEGFAIPHGDGLNVI